MKKFRKNLIGAVCAAALVCTAGGAALWTNTEKASATDAGVLVNYDFSENVDTAFAAPASTYGWITQNGKLRTDYSYSATEAKRIGYLKTPIALNESKYISFDFYAARLFDVALVETAGDFNAWSTNSIGFHTNSNNWLTLNKNIDLAAGWLADYTGVGNCLADCVHTLEIISDGAKLTFKVDGNVAFSDVAIPANEVYLVLQSTADTYIDNLYIAASATEAQPQTGYFGFNRATEGNYFSAPVGNYGWKVSGEGFSPYLPTVEGNVVTGNKMGYLNQAIALNEAKYISLDFYAAGNTDIGLVEAANPFNGWSRTAIAVHARTEGFVNLSDYIDYGLDGSWKGDFTQLGGCVADKSHTLEIISDGANLTFKLDGETVVWNNHNENVADDIASVAIPANSVYLTVQSDNAETYIDNVYIAESAPVEETDKSFDFSGYVNEFTAQGGGAGMSAKNGKFVANNAWGAARSVETLNLTSVEKITMDFCLASSDADKQFNVGFFADFDNVSEAGTGKCISVGATLFIGSQFGRNAWIADVGANLYDDVLHTLTITFADGNMSVMVDNIAYETLTTAIPAEEAYMLMQLTSTASYVDNLSIKYKEVEVPKYDLTIQDLAGETVTTIENVSGEFTIPEYPTAQGKVFLGYLVGNQLFQAGDTVVINQDFTITAIEATFAMVDGASIRIDAPTGMRFTTTLTWDAYEAISSFASFGTLIAKAEDVAADYTDLTTAFEGTYLNIEQTKYQEKNGNFQFNGVLVNIKESHFDWNFASRAYMTVTYTDGDEVTFYTNGETRNVAQVAEAAYNDRKATSGEFDDKNYQYETADGNYSPYTTEQLGILKGFFATSTEPVYYVSPNGNDNNSGKGVSNALATLEKAVQLCEGTENATVYLLDGEYEISETVEIPSNVTVESLSGNALLSGASKVSATEIVEKTDAKLGRVWEIPCKKKTNQLYVNDKYAVRARYPDVGQELRFLAADTVTRQMYVAPADVAGFTTAQLKDSVMVAFIKWGDSYLRVKDVADKTVDGFSVKAFSFNAYDSAVFTRGTLNIYPRTTYHLEDSEAFLNARGEWFFDETKQVIRYLPYADETLENTTVRIPQTETLLSVQGESGYPVENVTVRGISFGYTANGYVDGKLGGQANAHHEKQTFAPQTMGEVGRPVSAINMRFINNVLLENNAFVCLGGGGIDVLCGGNATAIQNNLFQGIGGNAVLVGTLETDASKVAASYNADNNLLNYAVDVTGNYFTDIGWQEQGACAIVHTYAANCRIVGNTIRNATYSGISYGWGWATTAVKGANSVYTYPTTEFLYGGTIANNLITNVMTTLNDSGAIYLAGCQPNTTIYGNYIADCYNGVYKYADDKRTENSDGENAQIWWANAGIYLDTAAGGTTDADKVLVYDNYVAADVANQQYEFCNSSQTYTIDGKEKADCRIYMDNGVSPSSVKANAGSSISVDGIVLFGTHTQNESTMSIYGQGFGTEYSQQLTVNGAAIDKAKILSWTDGCVQFTTTGLGVSADIRFGSSNSVYGAMNVDYAYDSKTRFEEAYGTATKTALDVLWAMDSKNDKKTLTNFAASTSIDGYAPEQIADGYAWSGWSVDLTTENLTTGGAWISFDLKTPSALTTLILYDRTDTLGKVESDVYAKNFKIYGYTQSGQEVLLYETASVSAMEDDGMLTLDFASLGYASTVFTGFKLHKTNENYFYVAEIAVF